MKLIELIRARSEHTMFGKGILDMEFVYNEEFICICLEITIFPFESTMFTFLIPTSLALLQSCKVPMILPVQ